MRRQPNVDLGEYVSISQRVVDEVGKLCSQLKCFLVNHPDVLSHIWIKFVTSGGGSRGGERKGGIGGSWPNPRIQYLLGNSNYSHEQNAKEETISLFRADLYFQLIEYNRHLITIAFQK